MSANNGKIKREDFIKDFTDIMTRILSRELPEKATNAEFVHKAYGSVYIRLRHINEGCQAISQPKDGD